MSEPHENEEQLRALRVKLWKETKKVTSHRLDSLEDSLKAMLSGRITEKQREKAAGVAHKLVGSLAAFGFVEECRQIQMIAQVLRSEDQPSVSDGRRTLHALLQLRSQIEQAAEEMMKGFGSGRHE